MTDAEIDALARDIVTQTIAYLEGSGTPPFSEVRKTNAGDPLIVYKERAAQFAEYGEFTVEFAPLEPVKRIVRKCGAYYDSFKVNATDPTTGKQKQFSLAPDKRDHWVGNMAANATVLLISQFRSELWLTIEESLEDCYLVGVGFLASGVGKNLSERSGEAVTDATEAIEKAAKRVSEKKRNKLRTIIRDLTNFNLITEHPRGRKRKSQSAQERERQEYSAKIESVYRSLRKTGSQPTKTRVGKELGEGGFSPKTGNDTSLNAFSMKLGRLGINYDEIVKKVEDELHNNS